MPNLGLTASLHVLEWPSSVLKRVCRSEPDAGIGERPPSALHPVRTELPEDPR